MKRARSWPYACRFGVTPSLLHSPSGFSEFEARVIPRYFDVTIEHCVEQQCQLIGAHEN